MRDYIYYTLALFIAFPFIITFLAYWITKLTKKHTWKAVHNAVQWSAIFFILGVGILLQLLFGRSFFGWIILLFLISLAGILIQQYRNQTEIEVSKAIKIVWRSAFLLFSSAYIILGFIYIISEVLS
ncbi:DUF3397 domain-containing protein [Oceanobacillus neutriphilus]|uniref:DUF3397 domain-containing protein n=1 Tax=Oceanobacillus neutriphilus TaxID=531815 RepID=A0ABQ2P1I9_9BACI|nr:DUF3397 domain-containing protein [Oceanobacillus neutriphilus]GGP15756.1 hypothetical protein GCM10011346_44960 [Oceanobacillus neutriphilus]